MEGIERGKPMGMTMKRLAIAILSTIVLVMKFVAIADAATIVFDPGPGTDYLGVWCGGQGVNDIATGFDAAGNPATLVKVTTTCHGSGRGSPNQYYLACWIVTFARDGTILSKQWQATNHWAQGQPAIPCPVAADPLAVYEYVDGAGNFPATLSTELVGVTSGVYRAMLETTCAQISYGDIVSGTIVTQTQACYSFTGSAGNIARVSVTKTSGTLLAIQEVHRPDGTVLCSATSGIVDCTLDVSGLYTIVVRDSNGTGTGDYNLTLTRADVPHLTIGMTATLKPSRNITRLSYKITVGNDGVTPAENVVIEDLLPKGLAVRRVSSTQGSCSYALRAITCTVGSVAPSGSVVVTVGAATALSSRQITNTACVDSNNCATTITRLPKLD